MIGPPRRSWTGPEYRIEVDFRAPPKFVYHWCTDYHTDDARLEGESYHRRVIARSSGRMVFEDLQETRNGWDWGRCWVVLRPPAAWHAERRGNRREETVDYRLRALGPESTRLTLRLRRRALEPEPRLSKEERERTLSRTWGRFRSSLEAEYRREMATPPGGVVAGLSERAGARRSVHRR
ncbi:MAG: hypothetical protein ACREC5_01380 [Thermoplasmata archaeon]